MAVESNNTKGNRWHSSKDGKFISGPKGEEIGIDELNLGNFGLDLNDLDIDELASIIDLDKEELSLDDFADEELSLDDFDEDELNEEDTSLEDALKMSKEQYKLVYTEGRKLPSYDNMNDVLKNIDSFFTPELINSHIKNAKIAGYGYVYIKGTNNRCQTGFAFDFFTRARSANTHFKGISNEEFEEKLKEVPQNVIAESFDKDSSYMQVDTINDALDVFIKNGKTAYLPLWHGISGVQSHRNLSTIFAQYKDNVPNAADTVLIGEGCYDYACYAALCKGYSYNGYSGGHVDGSLLRLLAPIDEYTKVCIDDVNGYNELNSPIPKNWKTKSQILKEYRNVLPQLRIKIASILNNNGVPTGVINDFLDSMELSSNGNNRSVPLALMGFDYVWGNTDQFDIINPSRVMMNVEKYRPDDD